MIQTKEKSNNQIFIIFCIKAVCLLCIAILLFLSIGSLLNTEYYFDYEMERVVTNRDSILLNLIAFLLLLFAIYIVYYRCNQRKRQIFEHLDLAAGVLAVLFGVISIAWVFVSKVAPYADQLSVIMVAQACNRGDYSMFCRGSYMFQYYDLQCGIVWILQLFLRVFGNENYRAFQVFNAINAMVLFYAGYKVTKLLFKEVKACCYYFILLLLFAPIILYVPFVYGEISSLAAMLVSTWMICEYSETKRLYQMLIAILFTIYAVLIRKSSVVFIIAICIYFILNAIKEKKLNYLFYTIVIVIGMMLATYGIQSHYERITGIENRSSTIWYHLAMGNQENNLGPGWYSGYDTLLLESVDYDNEKAEAIAKEDTKERFEKLSEHPLDGIDFYRRKLMTQWNQPDMSSFWVTQFFEQEPSRIVRWVYYGKLHYIILKILNYHQFMIYFGSLLILLLSWRKRRELDFSMLLIAVIGGFLLSIVWEAKSRYILAYYVFLIPYAAGGMDVLSDRIVNVIKQHCNKKIEKA